MYMYILTEIVLDSCFKELPHLQCSLRDAAQRQLITNPLQPKLWEERLHNAMKVPSIIIANIYMYMYNSIGSMILYTC